MNWRFDPLADDVAQEPLRDARLHCLNSAKRDCQKQSHLASSFTHLGCFAYCGDVDALKILTKLCAFVANYELADRAYSATNTEGITWSDVIYRN
ncbi:MAG: hypothetical protein LBJ89_02315 [Holosporales bacterium]|jgi:hypothetical protein|nr:hypothetical protein [Holosporales bacterium]